jgi:glutamate-1-semialdehyde 2,1-aminomutase
MAAGLASLHCLENTNSSGQNGWQQLEDLGAYLESRLAPIFARATTPLSLVRLGSIFWLSLQAGPAPRRADGIEAAGSERYGKIFHGLMQRGISLAPSAYEVGFLSLAHDRSHVDQLAQALTLILD